jgi:lipoprotein NlpI
MESKHYRFGLLFGLTLLVAAFRLVKTFHHDPPPPEAAAGLAAEKSGDFAGAVSLYTKALIARTLSPDVRFGIEQRRAFAYLQNGQNQLAIHDFDDVIRANPHDILALSGRGMSFFGQKDFEGALADFNSVFSLGSKDPAIPNNLFQPKALAEFYLGRFDKAEKDFRSASNFKPADAYSAIWLNLAESHQRKDGSAELKSRAAKLNLEAWPGPVVRLYLGESRPETVMEAAAIGEAKT